MKKLFEDEVGILRELEYVEIDNAGELRFAVEHDVNPRQYLWHLHAAPKEFRDIQMISMEFGVSVAIKP